MPEGLFRFGHFLFHLLFLHNFSVVSDNPVFAGKEAHRDQDKEKVKSKKSIFHAIPRTPIHGGL